MNNKKIMALALTLAIGTNTIVPVLAQNQEVISINYESTNDRFEYKYSDIKSHKEITNAEQVWDMSELD